MAKDFKLIEDNSIRHQAFIKRQKLDKIGWIQDILIDCGRFPFTDEQNQQIKVLKGLSEKLYESIKKEYDQILEENLK